jgi:hypothetical protein
MFKSRTSKHAFKIGLKQNKDNNMAGKKYFKITWPENLNPGIRTCGSQKNGQGIHEEMAENVARAFCILNGHAATEQKKEEIIEGGNCVYCDANAKLKRPE